MKDKCSMEISEHKQKIMWTISIVIIAILIAAILANVLSYYLLKSQSLLHEVCLLI